MKLVAAAAVASRAPVLEVSVFWSLTYASLVYRMTPITTPNVATTWAQNRTKSTWGRAAEKAGGRTSKRASVE